MVIFDFNIDDFWNADLDSSIFNSQIGANFAIICPVISRNKTKIITIISKNTPVMAILMLNLSFYFFVPKKEPIFTPELQTIKYNNRMKLKALKLNQLSKTALENRQMNFLKGGGYNGTYNCGCHNTTDDPFDHAMMANFQANNTLPSTHEGWLCANGYCDDYCDYCWSHWP